VVALGVERFDLIGEGAGTAAPPCELALARQDIGSVALATPDGLPNEAFREIKRPVLVLSGISRTSPIGALLRI
jgi:hypothetical protein